MLLRPSKVSPSNPRAQVGTLSLRRQVQTRNRTGAEHLTGITASKRDPDIRNLHRAPHLSDTKIILAAALILAPAITDTTGQL
jgi:hypothetical protein